MLVLPGNSFHDCRRSQLACWLRQWVVVLVGMALSLMQTAAKAEDLQRQHSPKGWVEELQRVRNNKSVSPFIGLDPWLLVAYRAPIAGDGGSPVKIFPLTPETWSQQSLTETVDGTSVAYSLSLNGPTAFKGQALDHAGQSDGRASLAQTVMVIAGASLGLDLAAARTDQATDWSLWALSRSDARLVYSGQPSVDRAVNTEAAALAFLRQALGYDGIVVATENDVILARVIHSRVRVGQTALVLHDSSNLLRIPDERQHKVAALFKVISVYGPWATLTLVAAPKAPIFAPGAKVILDTEIAP